MGDGNQEQRGGGLEHIGKTLLRLRESEVGKQMREVRVVPDRRIEERECSNCGKKFEGEVTVYTNFTPPREVRSNECPECKATREAEEKTAKEEELRESIRQTRDLWRRRCGIPAALQLRTFDNFERDRQKRIYDVCKKYAAGFNVESAFGYPSLILYSDVPGVGKTHLLVAIANHIIDTWAVSSWRGPCPISFASGPGLVRRIRSTYNLTDFQPHHEREEDVYREVTGCKLLLLDDVGKETPSKFTRELYWYIIDERVKSGLPVLISSRLALEGENSLEELMGMDTVDRLYGMCRGRFETLHGPSYRREEKTA